MQRGGVQKEGAHLTEQSAMQWVQERGLQSRGSQVTHNALSDDNKQLGCLLHNVFINVVSPLAEKRVASHC